MFRTQSLREETLNEKFVPDDWISIIWNWVEFNSTFKYDTTIGEAR